MVTVEESGNQQFTNDLIITKEKVVVICPGEIFPRKCGDRDMSAVRAADSGQVNFSTHSSFIKADCLVLLESYVCVCVCVCVCVVGGWWSVCLLAVGYSYSGYSPCTMEAFYLLYGCCPYKCAKLFTDQTKFSNITQRNMWQKIEFHHVSSHRRHGTHMGIRNANIISSGVKYL